MDVSLNISPLYDAEGRVTGASTIARDISRRRQSEEQLRLALEAGRMGTWEWDLRNGAFTWSLGLAAIHGRIPDDFPRTFDAYRTLIHSDDRERVFESIAGALERGEEHHVEYRVVWPEGRLRWVEARGRPFRDQEGKPERLMGVCVDVDERKRLEQDLHRRMDELAEAEDRMRAVVDTVVDGILTIDERGIVQTLNPAAEKIFGYRAEEVVGRNVRLLMPEPRHGEPDDSIANYLGKGEAPLIGVGREVVGRRKDGSTFPMDLAVSQLQLGPARFSTGIVRDITERKRGEQLLRFLADASAALAEVVDHRNMLQRVARLAVPSFADWCVVDMLEEGGTLERLAAAHVDPGKAQLALTLSEPECPDPPPPAGVWNVIRSERSELLPQIEGERAGSPNDPERLSTLRELGMKSSMIVPLAIRSRVLGAVTFVMGDSGRRYGEDDLAVAEDLAHRVGVAFENARLYEAFREADRRKDEFLALLGHELRNPLAPITNALYLIRLPAADASVKESAGQVMERQVQHMVRLVDDLLDVSRIARGRIEMRKERVEIAAVVARAVET
ncbi:MAG TPA: PAS domain S-box protein, partial [Vicinamibacteria bacterium]